MCYVLFLVMLQPFEFDPAEKTKHKFMIQSIVMEGEVTESDVVSAFKLAYLL